ncbi:MAG: autotransporter-associated beta strand repeat-containing protein [Burkholderiales bacterium]|nr:autotransporter-associated beta strand repeat-containing protein [Burkholderiales bacterium]
MHLAHANPTGPALVNGQVTFQTRGGLLSVTNSPGAIINWQQFSIGAGETTRFVQQSAASTVLNRVVGGDPSRILGTLQSNGRVFLVNPGGIVFGPGAQIDVAGLVASTLHLSNADFLGGRLNFTGDPGQAAAVVNHGRIGAASGGNVYLVGGAVENQGVITAPGGGIVLAAGQSVRVTEGAGSALHVEIAAPSDRALNLSDAVYGTRGIYAGLVRNGGVIVADSAVRGADGRIVLKASGGLALDETSRVTASGREGGRIVVDAQRGAASVAGTIEATGASGRGGTIAISGTQTRLREGAMLDASGAGAGGSVLVGGDLQGAPIRDGALSLGNSQESHVAPSARIVADAKDAGDGGKVVVWADGGTRFQGSISARGGANGGDGGAVEVSGRKTLRFKGGVDTRAPRGRAGSLLLDPANITVVDGAGDGDDADLLDSSFSGTPSGAVGTVAGADVTPTVLFRSELEAIAATTSISLAATDSITIGDLAGNNLNLAQVPGHSVSFQAGTFSMNPGDAITTAGGAVNITTTAGGAAIGAIAANGGAVTFDLAGASSVAGAISGAGTSLAKLGAGTLTLNGASTYSGTTTVSAGTLALGTNNALPAASAVVVDGTGTLAIGGFDQTLAGVQLVAGAITGSGGTLTSTSAYDLRSGTVGAVLAGAVGLTKSTGGTVTLSGANSYTGATAVNAGVLNLQHANAAGTTAGGVSVADGAALELQGGIAVGGEALAIAGSGVGGSGALRNVSGDNTWGATVTLTGGGATVRSDAGRLTLSAATAVSGAAQNLTLTGAGAGEIGGTIATTTGTVTKTGTGTFVLAAANTYTGGTAVSEGTLAVTANDALGGTAAGTTVAAGATLDLRNVSYSTLEPLVLNGGIVTASTGTSSFANAITLGATSGVAAGAGAQLALPGVLSGAGFGIAKTGAGTVVLSGNNDYTGATTVLEGTLSLGAGSRLHDSSSLVVNGGAFDLGAFNETVAGVQLLSGTITGSSGVLTSNSTYDLQSGTVSAIIAGNVGVTKSGGGTVVLTRVNTYTGATAVNGGTLAVTVNGALSDPAAGTTVGAGGTLDFRNVAYTTLEPLTLSGGTVNASSGTSSFTNDIALTAGSGVAADGGAQLTLPGILTGVGLGVTKTGEGTVVLSGDNAYTGTTRVNAGTLALGASHRLNDASTLVVNGGTFDILNFNETVAGVQLLAGTITGGSGVLTSTSNFDLQSGTVSAIITGNVGVTKSGGGTVVLTRANTYTGATAVNAGILAVTANGALSDTAAGTSVQAGATLDFRNVNYATAEPVTLAGGTVATSTGTSSFSGPVSLTANSVASVTGTQLTLAGVVGESGGSFGLTKVGAGTLIVTADNTYTGTSRVNEGTLALGASHRLHDSSRLVVNGGTFDVLNFNETVAGVQLLSGTITGGSGVLTSTSDFDLQGGTVSAIITGPDPVGVVKSGPGTVVLTRENTYPGATAVNGGTLAVTSNNALGTVGAGTTVQPGATLDFRNVNYASLEPLALAGGTVATSTGTSAFAGPVSLTAASFASVTGTQLTLSGVVSESGGSFGLTKTGTGTLVVSGDNTYTGTTRVNEGTLALGAAERLHDASSVVVAGGTFDIRQFNERVAGVQLLSGTITGTAGVLTSTSDFDLQSGTVSAIITGAVGVDKSTAGTVTLTRDNTYTGTTEVTGGTLRVTAPGALGTTTAGTTVAGGATLAIVNTAVVAEPVALNGAGVGGAGALTGSGTASLAGPVTLDTASTIGVGLAADSLVLSGVIEGAGALNLIGAGTITFGDTVGDATALASLTQPAATRLNIDGGLVRTAGGQTYNGPVVTGGATTLRTTAGGSVSAPGVVNATAGTLTLDTGAGDATLANALNDFGTVAVTSGGAVTLVDANAITIGDSDMGTLLARALAGNVTLAGAVAATGSGDSIVLVASGNFVNNAGPAALDSGPGRWLVYSTNPELDTRGGLAYDFKQYNAPFGAAVPGAGDGFLYTVAPVLTPSLTGTVEKTYDATTAATLAPANYAFSGVLDGDTIELDNAAGGTYDTADAGTGKLVSVDGFSLAGARNGTAIVYGYSLSSTAASGNVGAIDRAPLAIKPDGQAKTYGDTFTFNGTEFTSIGLQGGQTIGSVALASAGEPASAPVAGSPYTITGSAATGGTFTPANYLITYDTGELTVNRAPLVVTANDQVKGYGGSPFVFSGMEFTSAGLRNGEAIDRVTLTSPATLPNAPVAGSPYPITPSAATGAGFVPGNYAITYVDGQFTVNPAGVPLTVTANNQVKPYGTVRNFTGTEFTASGLQNSETIGRVVLASTGAPAGAPVQGSPYVITVSGATGGTFNPGNYTITYVDGQLTVAPAPLAIRANDESRLVGAPNPPFTATYQGFRLGETPAVLTGTLLFNTAATPSSPPDTYAIRPSGVAGANYAITFVNGTLTVLASRALLGRLPDQVLIELSRLGVDDWSLNADTCLYEDIGASPAVAPATGMNLKPRRGCAPSAADASRLPASP